MTTANGNPTTKNNPLELYPCEMCSSDQGFIYDFGEGFNPIKLCPPCSQNAALSDAAQDQLERLLIPVVRAWAKHWGPILSTTQGYTHASSLLEGLGENFWRISVPALEGLE